MSVAPSPRKVLVVEDEPSIRNLLYVLLGALQCEGDIAYTGQQALAMVAREPFDAVLLDLRCTDQPPEQMMSRICAVRPSLMGRVLFITGEVSDPETMAFVERNCAPHVARARLMEDLGDRLRALMGLPSHLHPAT